MKDPLHSVFFLGLFSLLFYGLWEILLPFAGAILGAVIVAVLFYPMHVVFRRYTPRMKESPRALMTTLVVAILFILPTLIVSWSIIHEAQQLSEMLGQTRTSFEEWRRNGGQLSSPWAQSVQLWLYKALGIQKADLQRELYDAITSTLASVGAFGADAAKNLLLFAMQIFVTVTSLFFLFRDGESMFEGFKRWIPMKERDKIKIADQLHLTMTGVVRGTLLTAGVQGLTAAIGFLIVGTPAAVTLGFLTFLASLIPFLGAFIVWFPVAISYFFQASMGKGVFLMLWGGFIVSLVDNILRPYLIGNRVNMPFLYFFFAVLGGVQVFGFKGLLLGPIIVSLVPVFMEIYKDRYGTGTEEVNPS